MKTVVGTCAHMCVCGQEEEEEEEEVVVVVEEEEAEEVVAPDEAAPRWPDEGPEGDDSREVCVLESSPSDPEDDNAEEPSEVDSDADV